jgi:hypothetical protein
MAVLLVVNILVGLVCAGLRGASHGLCLTAPARSGSMIKGLAITTLALFLTGFAGQFGSMVISWISFGLAATGGAGFNPGAMMSGAGISWVLSLVGMLTGWAANIVYLFFLRSVAYNVRDQSLYKQITTFILCTAILLGLTILVTLIAWMIIGMAVFGGLGSSTPQGAQRAGATAGAAFIGMCGFTVLAGLSAFALFIWFIVILFQVRSSVERHARRI